MSRARGKSCDYGPSNFAKAAVSPAVNTGLPLLSAGLYAISTLPPPCATTRTSPPRVTSPSFARSAPGGLTAARTKASLNIDCTCSSDLDLPVATKNVCQPTPFGPAFLRSTTNLRSCPFSAEPFGTVALSEQVAPESPAGADPNEKAKFARTGATGDGVTAGIWPDVVATSTKAKRPDVTGRTLKRITQAEGRRPGEQCESAGL